MVIRMTISERAKVIKPSATMSISSKAKEMKSQGIDVIGFGAGEPYFDTPDNIKHAAKKAIDDGFTKYTPASGTIELKQAICKKFYQDNSIEYEPKQVSVSNGGKHVLFNICMALLNPEDEVLLPMPAWLSYEEQINVCGAKKVPVETGSDFKLKAHLLEDKVTDKTKMLILNSPNNPSGAVIEERDLGNIAEFCVNNNIMCLSDEVYEPFIYDGKKHKSIASLGKEIREKTLTVNAVSKAYSMTGWRIGYCAGPEAVIKAMNNLQSHSTSGPCTISQKAALEALAGNQQSIEDMRKAFSKRRDYMVSRLNNMKDIKCNMPQGSFYAFPDISETGMKSMEFCEKLLEEKKVALVPGQPFGADNNVRLSYCSSMENISKGLDRLEEFLQ